MGIALDGQKKSNDQIVESDGISFVYEKPLAEFVDEAIVDFRKSWFGEEGFAVDIGGCC